jgi:hypothetical protein
MTGTVQKLVVVVTNTDTNDTVERWVFDIITDLPQAGFVYCDGLFLHVSSSSSS